MGMTRTPINAKVRAYITSIAGTSTTEGSSIQVIDCIHPRPDSEHGKGIRSAVKS